MVTPVFVFFEGLEAPVDLGGSTELVDLLLRICPGWPFEVRDATDVPPFFRAIPDGKRFLAGQPDKPPKRIDAVNAVCDIVAALPDDRGFLSDCLLCLHAAAVKTGDGLILFPNTKKAGKSTLSVALAQMGMPLFTDDFVRIRQNSGGSLEGVANGILPRLRLPLPDGVDAKTGPGNRQYLYPEVPVLPATGTGAPLKALVFLERREGETARLEEVTADGAMRAMLYQNFGRHLHSGTTLATLAPIVEGLGRHRLVYDQPDEAATLLCERMTGLSLPEVLVDPGLDQTFLDDLPEPEIRWTRGARARQVPGVTTREVGKGFYAADPEGRGIERLDTLARAIWEILTEPATESEIADLLAEVFADTPRDRIAGDVDTLLHGLARAGLIETP